MFTHEKILIEPILQDFSVSSITDVNPDILLPSDSSLMMTTADCEVVVANMSSSHTMPPNSFTADSTVMENVENKSQGPRFKKPFNVKYRKKPRSSLFDLDLKDSEPDTPEQNILLKKPFNAKYNKKPRPSLFDLDMNDSELDTPEQRIIRPFQRKKKNDFEPNMLANGSFNTNLSSTKENLDLSNCSQNLSSTRKNRTVENSLDGENTTSQSYSFPAGPVFQRQKTNHAKKIPSVFYDVFEQSSDSSLSNVIPVTSKSYQVETQEKLDDSLRKCCNKAKQHQDVFPENMNFITRRKARQLKLMKSKIFDNDILTSESDESFSLKPAFKTNKVVQKVSNFTIFDDSLDISNSYKLSSTKSPTLNKPPLKILKRNEAKDMPVFDSIINDLLNKTEKKDSVSHNTFSKKHVKEGSNDSINFDDVVNSTYDGSSLTSNSLTLKNNIFDIDENSNPSNDSSQPTLDYQAAIDISNNADKFKTSCSLNMSTVSEINNESDMEVPFVNNAVRTSNICCNPAQEDHENIVECTEKGPKEDEPSIDTTKNTNTTLTVSEDQVTCPQLICCKSDLSSKSKKTSTKLNKLKEVNSGLSGYAEENSPQICSIEKAATGTGDKTIKLTENELRHTLKSNNMVNEFTKGKLSVNRVIDYTNEDLSHPDLNVETSNNKSILKPNIMTFNVSGTNRFVQEEPRLKKNLSGSVFQIQCLTESPRKSLNSESKYYKHNKDGEKLLKSAENNNESCSSSLCTIKKQNIKRVSFKLRNEKGEKKTDRNSVLNISYPEERSYSRYNQSRISDTSCSLEALVLDGSSSEIKPDSVFLDLSASRNKSSSVNMSLNSNSCQSDNLYKKGVLVQPHCREIAEPTEEDIGDKEMDVDSLDNQYTKSVLVQLHCDEIAEPTEKEVEDSLEYLDGELGTDLEDETEKLDEEEMKQISEGRHEKEHNAEDQVLMESSMDRSVHFDESSSSGSVREGITDLLQYTDCEMDEFLEDNGNSLLCTEKQECKNPNSLRVNIYNYQFKKPGSCTVLNEHISTPPSKRKIQEMLAKMPLSELKGTKSKPVCVALTKEQMEQNKIEELLRRRLKPSTVHTSKTPKLTKPKYMQSKVYDFLVEKLTPSFGIKSRVQAENVVKLLNEQVDVIMKKENKLVQTVQEMKVKLANLKIIRTHWDFYRFIMKYFDGPFTLKVYPPGVVSLFEPDDPFQNVCD